MGGVCCHGVKLKGAGNWLGNWCVCAGAVSVGGLGCDDGDGEKRRHRSCDDGRRGRDTQLGPPVAVRLLCGASGGVSANLNVNAYWMKTRRLVCSSRTSIKPRATRVRIVM